MARRCGNVAAILELDENLNKNYKIFEAAPQVCPHPYSCVRVLTCNTLYSKSHGARQQREQHRNISYRIETLCFFLSNPNVYCLVTTTEEHLFALCKA